MLISGLKLWRERLTGTLRSARADRAVRRNPRRDRLAPPVAACVETLEDRTLLSTTTLAAFGGNIVGQPDNVELHGDAFWLPREGSQGEDSRAVFLAGAQPHLHPSTGEVVGWHGTYPNHRGAMIVDPGGDLVPSFIWSMVVAMDSSRTTTAGDGMVFGYAPEGEVVYEGMNGASGLWVHMRTGGHIETDLGLPYDGGAGSGITVLYDGELLHHFVTGKQQLRGWDIPFELDMTRDGRLTISHPQLQGGSQTLQVDGWSPGSDWQFVATAHTNEWRDVHVMQRSVLRHRTGPDPAVTVTVPAGQTQSFHDVHVDAFTKTGGGTTEFHGENVVGCMSIDDGAFHSFGSLAIGLPGSETCTFDISNAEFTNNASVTSTVDVNVTNASISNPNVLAIDASLSLSGSQARLDNEGDVSAQEMDVGGGSVVNHSPGTLAIDTSLTIHAGADLRNDGNVSAAQVDVGGTLSGNGTVSGPVNIAAPPGTLAILLPGTNPPGRLTTGDLTMGVRSALKIQVNGGTAGVADGYGQVRANGAVKLEGGFLDLQLAPGFNPALGQMFTIVDSTGGVTGQFNGLPEGVAFELNNRRFHVTYQGGSGTDVVVSRNNRPAGQGKTASTDEDVPLNGRVHLADPDGDPVTAQLVAGPSNGTLQLNDDGRYTYTPDEFWSGIDSFVYRVNDGELNSAQSYTVTINVHPVANAPDLTVEDASGEEGSPIPLHISASLIDRDGSEVLDPLVISGVPAGMVLNQGERQENGDWIIEVPALLDVRPADLDLTLSAPDNLPDEESFTLTVTAVSREAFGELANHDTAATEAAFQVTVFNVAPVLSEIADRQIDEGALLSLEDVFSFTDPGFDNPAIGTTESFIYVIDWGDGTPLVSGDVTDVTQGTFGTPTTGAFGGSHIFADKGVYTVTATVTDNDGGSDTQTFNVSVNNVAPTLTLVDDQTVDEGSLLDLSGLFTFTDPGFDNPHNPSGATFESFTYVIDWGDGTPVVTGDVTDVTQGTFERLADGTPVATLTTGTFGGSHIYPDQGVYTVTVTVTDDDGGSDTQTFDVSVNNVAPTITSFEGSSFNLDGDGQPIAFSGVRGQTLTFAGTFTDPGFDNPDHPGGATFETFTYSIDWGDGTPAAGGDVTDVAQGRFERLETGKPVATLTEGAFAGTHVFTEEGTYTITVNVTDDDGGSHTAAWTATIEIVSMQVGGDLAVGGTMGNDRIHFSPGPNDGDVQLRLDNKSLGVYQPTGKLIAFGQDGNDDIQVANGITLTAWLFGGDGNNRIRGGGGDNLIVGGSGSDLIVGGQGRNILIGGMGANRIVGGGDDDLLVAGRTAFDSNYVALAALMAEWTSERDYEARRLNINGLGEGERLNGGYFLRAQANEEHDQTIYLDEDSRNMMTGAGGDDWFFFDPDSDKVTDLRDEVFANDLDWILDGGD